MINRAQDERKIKMANKRLTQMLNSKRSLHYRFENGNGSGVDLLVYVSEHDDWVFCPITWTRNGDLTDTHYQEYRTYDLDKALNTLKLAVKDARKVRYLR